MADLLQVARSNFTGNQVSALGLEAMLRLTEGPKTAAQLVAETGCSNGTLIRQLHRYCIRYDPKTEQVITPQLKLIEREQGPKSSRAIFTGSQVAGVSSRSQE